MTTATIANAIDYRDMPMGSTFFVVTTPNGRCVMHPDAPMFKACWANRKQAKEVASALGAGHTVIQSQKD